MADLQNINQEGITQVRLVCPTTLREENSYKDKLYNSVASAAHSYENLRLEALNDPVFRRHRERLEWEPEIVREEGELPESQILASIQLSLELCPELLLLLPPLAQPIFLLDPLPLMLDHSVLRVR